MNLLVDIGNTRIKWGVARDGVILATEAVTRTHHADWTARLPAESVTAIHVASVGHDSAMTVLQQYAVERGLNLHRAVSAARSGALVNAYAEPQRLGVDRWMACIAAQARAPGSALVADAGTALTLDWIDADGTHGGGLIAPGVTSMRGALRRSTQLRPTHAPEAPVWLARDTETAIASGTLHSAIALLDAAVAQHAPARLLLTGGEARLLSPRLAQAWEIVPHLVLEGLALHVQRESGAGQPACERSE